MERIEAATRGIAAELLRRIEARRTPDFHDRLASDPLFRWHKQGADFLTQAFRFIDVFPALRSDEEIEEYLPAFLGGPQHFLGTASTDGIADAVRDVIAALLRRFTGGETRDEALAAALDLRRQGMAATLDILGEAVNSEDEAEAYLENYVGLLRAASEASKGWAPCPQADEADYGPVPRLNVSVKLSSLYSRLDPIDPEGAFRNVAPRLRKVFAAARSLDASLNVDMEQYAIKDLTLDIFQRVLDEPDFRDWPHASISIQTYLPENRADFAALAAWVERRGTPINLRLVKGAYWDHEVQNARYHGWPVPVYTRKEDTDADFEAACRFALERTRLFRVAVAGHNARSVARVIALCSALGLPENAVEFQTLQGLGEELRTVLVEDGRRARVYLPYGKLLPGMAYLVRRLLEATARSAFLRQMWESPLPVERLTAPPSTGHGLSVRASGLPPDTRVDNPRPVASFDGAELDRFRNEPVSDFSRPAAREGMADAIRRVRGELGGRYPLWIAGEGVETRDEIVSTNPADPAEVAGRVACASAEDAGRAVSAAVRAFPSWAETPARDRADLLVRVAALVRERRFELAAWEVLEVGKSWREADADVAEAIDYLEYYAREAVRLAEVRRRDIHGEDNEYFYAPRGVTAVISPWNFPLAILTGMSSAAVAAGNPVILKPAGPASVIAARYAALWREAGAPEGLAQFLPGRGSEAGEALVRHPDVAVIAFTGSLEVGLRIRRLCAEPTPGQRQIKQVIAELGGKNAVIVDRDADIDQAVPGVLASAFGYQGQKCSACSRVIVHRDVYEVFLDRLASAAGSLPIGPPEDPYYAVGPLIDAQAVTKAREYIALARESGRIVFEAPVPDDSGKGHYIGPVIVADVDPASRLAQEEIFGPVLCVLRAEDFDDAVRIANSVPYGLTAGLYSRHPDRIRAARRRIEAGNIYINRKITGAVVDRQPFGGVKLSGIGSKAGGPDYLLQFMRPVAFTEWTVRRGFAPGMAAESGPSW